MAKTIIGKSNYLFLTSEEVQNKRDVTNNSLRQLNQTYVPFIKNFALIVFPNKIVVCKDYFDGYKTNSFQTDLYRCVLKNNFVYEPDKFDFNDFYKTDSHMNLKGSLKIYYSFIETLKSLFKIDMEPKCINIEAKHVENLGEVNLGIGDLTWKDNLGDQILQSVEDTFYSSPEVCPVYCKKVIKIDDSLRVLNYQLVDETSLFEDQVVSWSNIISPKILYQKNDGKKHRVLIFYDSFLLSTISLYINMFEEVFLVKTNFNHELIKKINPNYIFEFRCERFLLL